LRFKGLRVFKIGWWRKPPAFFHLLSASVDMI